MSEKVFEDTNTKNSNPQIKVAFKFQDCGKENPNTLIANYKGCKITPHKNGWIPVEKTLYVCERPWFKKPSFYTKDGKPVFTVIVLPWIIGELSDKVTELIFINTKSRVNVKILPQTTFGKDAIIYCEVCDTKYVWVKNSRYVEEIETALTEKEKQESRKNPWKKVEGNSNLIKAPYYPSIHDNTVVVGMHDTVVAEVVTQTIRKEESKLLLK